MKYIKFSIIALFFAVLSACGGGDSSSGSGEPEGTDGMPLNQVIVVIGDSIGAGYGASVKYPDLLQVLTGIPVINISKPGTLSQEGVSRIPDLIEQHRPQYIVLQLGTNDTERGSFGARNAVSNLQYGASLAIQAGIIPIIGTIPPNTRSSAENEAAAQISAGVRGIAGARIAPIDISLNGSNLQSDGKHPNDSGQEIIAQLFAEQVLLD